MYHGEAVIYICICSQGIRTWRQANSRAGLLRLCDQPSLPRVPELGLSSARSSSKFLADTSADQAAISCKYSPGISWIGNNLPALLGIHYPIPNQPIAFQLHNTPARYQFHAWWRRHLQDHPSGFSFADLQDATKYIVHLVLKFSR
jgi:hypothetical protein